MKAKSNKQKKAVGKGRQPVQVKSSKGVLGYAPVAMSRSVQSGSIPRISSRGGVTHIEHTEYFNSVNSAGTAFAVQSFYFNPGIASCFPWLAQIAQRYETYRFRYVSFDYHTRAATSQVGTVGMVFDFDAQDPAPATQMEALTYHDKVADSPWKDLCLRLDLAQGDRLPIRYTRAGTLPGTSYDLKTFDLGRLHVFTDGVAASANLGLLEVNYSVDLYVPQVSAYAVGGTIIATAGLAANTVFGTNSATSGTSVIPGSVTSATTFTFDQNFQGEVTFILVGTVMLTATATGGTATSTLKTSLMQGNTNTVAIVSVNATPGQTLTLTVGCTTMTSSTVWFTAAGYGNLV